MLAINSSVLSLTPTHLAQCTNHKAVHIEVKELTIQYSQDPADHEGQDLNNGSVSGFTCWFNVTTSDDQLVQIEFLQQTCSQDNFLSLLIQVNDISEFLDRRTGCEGLRSPLLVDWVSRRHFALFAIVVHDLHVPYIIKVKAISVTSDTKTRLQLYDLSPNQGLLQSPGWNPSAGVTHPPFAGRINSTVHMRVPPGHTVMYSFLHVSVGTYQITQITFCLVKSHCTWSTDMVENRVEQGPEVYLKVGQSPMGPFIFPVRQDPVRIVYRVEEDHLPYPGFRLLFTIHQRSRRPTQTPEGQWNCSVDTWSTFRSHLDCNMVTQCLDGRDEEDCGYSRCQGVGFEVNGRCYSLRFMKNNRRNTQYSPIQQCQEEGAQIASLSTVREYEAVTRLIWTHQQFPVAVGLHSTFHGAPSMY
ncbi:uncharacterized protein LOC143288229 [Babylonia areolata]|uniref:uncharacterized protein LOC143288229 n=1 Tax=Babylonia areolata TaxID=304850 RepID=UPI003FD5D282